MKTITRRRNSWKVRTSASAGYRIVEIPRVEGKSVAGVIQTRWGFLHVQSGEGPVKMGANKGEMWGYSSYEFIWEGRTYSLWEDRFRRPRGLAIVGHRFVREVMAECAT